VKAPRLIGVLIDLPAPALSGLASAWGCPATPREVYEAITSPARLAAAVDALPDASRQVLRALATEPLRRDDLLARVAVGPETVGRSLLDLGALALVVRVGAGGRAQPLFGSVGREWLAVPREVAAALPTASTR
jgi:hypothetical protein